MDLLNVTVQDLGNGFVIRCAGELDILTREELTGALTMCVSVKPDFIHLDLRGLTFFACAGVDTLVEARRQAREHGIVLQLSIGECTRRVLRLLPSVHVSKLEYRGRFSQVA